MAWIIDMPLAFKWNDTMDQYDPRELGTIQIAIQDIQIPSYSRNKLIRIFINLFTTEKYHQDNVAEMVEGSFEKYLKKLQRDADCYDYDPNTNIYATKFADKLTCLQAGVIEDALSDLYGTNTCSIIKGIHEYSGARRCAYRVDKKKVAEAITHLVSNGGYQKLRDNLTHQFWSRFDWSVTKIFFWRLTRDYNIFHRGDRIVDSITEMRCMDKNDLEFLCDSTRPVTIASELLNSFEYTLTPDMLRDALGGWKYTAPAKRVYKKKI
jgi:hypothetical protein